MSCGVCLALAAAPADQTTKEQRAEAIRHATVWTATDVRAMNLKTGPRGADAFTRGQTVTCTFVPKKHGRGSTLKFDCAMPSGREIKVRYGGTNGEVYAQVAATRLLWALGFAANRMYPVRVVCRGCAPNPFKDQAPADASATVTFDPATIDEKADGRTLETKPDEGWSWSELDQVDERAGGATTAQRDALKLLAVFIQHSSNKAINQRLVCLDPPRCNRSQLIVADLGKTFGRANALNHDDTAAVNFKEWSRTPIWKGASGACVGYLAWTFSGSLSDPHISEPGRKFLADLLVQLSDAQIQDLFEVARVTQRDSGATVADWVRAFKAKRDEIANRRCEG
jgi:hypothetical protein